MAKGIVERLVGSALERAQQRVERGRAELAKIEQQLEERRMARDRALLDDAPAAVLSAVRGEIAGMERSRLYAMEDLTAGERALALAEQGVAARELAARWSKTRALCEQREQIAEKAQAQAEALGASWLALARLQSEILGMAPVQGVRTSRIAEDWRDGARAGIEGALHLASDGALAPTAAGGYVLSEFRRVAVAVPAVAAKQHRQILRTEQQAAINEPTKEAA